MVKTVIKRDGSECNFDKSKIKIAVLKAFIEVDKEETDYAKEKARDIANYVESLDIEKMSVEEIQNVVIGKLMASTRKDVATQYVEYKYKREQERALQNNLEERYIRLKKLITGRDEESNKENSNKDTRILPTMRDYIAGFTCKELANEVILPKEISEANNVGIIHMHDLDYSPVMPMSNCCLINLDDMLQNGTVINGKMIEKPHSFSTACTIVSQVCASVSSGQYGGQSFNVSHISPFVDVSRQKFIAELKEEYNALINACVIKDMPDEEIIKDIAELRVKKEVAKGVQTIQYQINTLMTTNGQSPFVTMFMWLDENDEHIDDTALVIEEILKQRLQGIKNEAGVYITPAFPKLIYVLDENNNLSGGRFDYITELAVKCSAKRMYPDYISAKIMRENYEGNVFTPMGK